MIQVCAFPNCLSTVSNRTRRLVYSDISGAPSFASPPTSCSPTAIMLLKSDRLILPSVSMSAVYGLNGGAELRKGARPFVGVVGL
jgi:hypothetical protein